MSGVPCGERRATIFGVGEPATLNAPEIVRTARGERVFSAKAVRCIREQHFDEPSTPPPRHASS